MSFFISVKSLCAWTHLGSPGRPVQVPPVELLHPPAGGPCVCEGATVLLVPVSSDVTSHSQPILLLSKFLPETLFIWSLNINKDSALRFKVAKL